MFGSWSNVRGMWFLGQCMHAPVTKVGTQDTSFQSSLLPLCSWLLPDLYPMLRLSPAFPQLRDKCPHPPSWSASLILIPVVLLVAIGKQTGSTLSRTNASDKGLTVLCRQFKCYSICESQVGFYSVGIGLAAWFIWSRNWACNVILIQHWNTVWVKFQRVKIYASVGEIS